MSPRRRENKPITHYLDDGSLYSNLGVDTGISFARAYFPRAKKELLIATAYFSVKGYNLTRSLIRKNIRIKILVGPHERDSQQLQQIVTNEVKRELSGIDSAQLYEAVVDLCNRIRAGLFFIADARQIEKSFHCKFYIINSRLLWQGSANFSYYGLTDQREQAAIISNPKVVVAWKAQFNKEISTARDLSLEVLQVLENYLNMSSPFGVYIKALLFLLKATNIQRQLNAYTPVYYQQYLATCAVHQISRYGGTLMVIATGLGKTIVGAEVAGILRETKENQHVILLAPNAVHSLWRDQLEGRGVSFTPFDYKILFQKTSKQKHYQISRLLKLLQNANEQILLIIDEAHVYRNQLSENARKKGRLALSRVSAATERGMKVLLLTGSAYCTNRQNLNSLLSFLPRSNTNDLLDRDNWHTESHRTFGKMPPVAVFSYPHVIEIAKKRGEVEEGCPYVEYEGKRRYIPTRIETQIVTFDLIEEAEIAIAFEPSHALSNMTTACLHCRL